MENVRHHVFECMGISIHATLTGIRDGVDEDLHALEHVFHTWDARFTRFRTDSELMRLNAAAGERTVVSPELFDVIEKCVLLARETDGVFDPSVGGRLAAHGYGLPVGHVLPIPAPDFRSIRLDRAARAIACAPGQVLEPASIVKGMAIDAAGREITHADGWMINAGGDILTRGAYAGASWRVGIQSPTDPNAIIAAVDVQDGAVATSGIYAVRDADGWNHLVDMTTGESVSDLVSVTVLANDAETADTHATIACLLGRGRAAAYLERHALPYLLVEADGRLTKDRAFAAREIELSPIL